MPVPVRPVPLGYAFAVACAGIAVFSAMDATMKRLGLVSGVYCALLWRSGVGTLLGGVVHFARGPARPGPRALRLHVERGLVVTAMATLFFWGLARVPMAQAIALCFVAPLLALGLSAALLGERVGRRAVAASGVAFAGVLAVLAAQARAPAGPEALRGSVAILAAALCYAYNLILMRRQGAESDAVEVAFFQNLVMAAALCPLAPWLGSRPLPSQWPLVIAAAVFATISNVALAWAYARQPASRLAPSEYTGFLWAALLGWAVFGERLVPATVAGAALIVAGCLLAARAPAPPIEAGL